MSNYSSLKATINANIKTNGNQEISGAVLNSVLNAMVDSEGAGYQFMGVATPSSPGTAQTPDYKCFYLASTPGTYTYLGGLVVADGEVAILKYDTAWSKEVTGAASAADLSQLGLKVDDIEAGLNGKSIEQTATANTPFYIPFQIVAGSEYHIIVPAGSVSYNVGYCDNIGDATKENLLIQVSPDTEHDVTPTYSGNYLRFYPVASGTLKMFIFATDSIYDTINTIESEIGDLENLETPNKGSIVDAINSILSSAEVVLNINIANALTGLFYNDSAGKVAEVANGGSKYFAPIDVSDKKGGSVKISGGYNGSSRLTGITDADGNWLVYKTDTQVYAAGSDGIEIQIPNNAKYLYISFSASASSEAISITYIQPSAIQQASNREYFVDGINGSDTNSGTKDDEAFKTIQKAVDAGASIIRVVPTEYKEQVSISNVENVIICPTSMGTYSTSVPDTPKIVINGENTRQHGLVIEGSAKVKIYGVEVKNTASHLITISESSDVLLQDCSVHNNIAGMGVAMTNVNARVCDCVAYSVAVDGFNIHGYGDTIFENCKAYSCGDDGISHHDGCTGYISGGEYYNCVKGGVASPAHGAKVDICGVYSHDNAYGLYAVSSDDRRAVAGKVSNCVFMDNSSSDIAVDNGTIVMWNTIYDTTYVAADATLTEITKNA